MSKDGDYFIGDNTKKQIRDIEKFNDVTEKLVKLEGIHNVKEATKAAFEKFGRTKVRVVEQTEIIPVDTTPEITIHADPKARTVDDILFDAALELAAIGRKDLARVVMKVA